MFSVLFGAAGTVVAAIPTSPETMVVQQGNKVSGLVSDDMGPIAGASVVVKGTSVGTITDTDGRFTLDNVRRGSVIVISFVGLATQEITWNGQANLNVKMSDATQDLDEVVVVAYGTAKKSTFTGSASVVKAEKLEKVMGTGFTEALQGMSAGVNVVNVQGNPGAEARVEIRGIASMSGKADPLYIVDGMPYDGGLNQINPTDIESMTVLKDAAATSLYGSRAANGVVMITTKRGKSAKPQINFRGAWGTSDNAVKNPKKANPYQQLENTWYALYYDALLYDGMDAKAAGDYASSQALTKQVKATRNSKGETIYVTPFRYINEDYVLHDGNGNPYMNPNLEYVWDEDDWDVYKAIFSRKLRQDYSVDISGQTGNGKTSYFFSGGYLDDQGYGNRQYYKRYSFRTNLSTELFDWWKVAGSLSYSRHRQNVSGGASRAANFTTTLSSPWLRNEDNTGWVVSEKTGKRMYDYGKYTNNFFGAHVLNNSGDYWDNGNDDSFDNNMGHILSAQFNTEFKLPYNLKFRSALNIDDYWSRSMVYTSAVHGSGQTAPYGISILADGGYASRYDFNKRSTTWNNVLSGDWSIGDHNISAMAGHEWYTWDSHYEQGWGEGIMELGKYELSNTTKNFGVWGGRDKYSLLSFFGKLDYNFLNKYYLSASIREDGSSRFSSDNRWGTFWSTGASWRISKEGFLEDAKWIDNLVLRASYGTTGNDKLIVRNASNGKAGDEVLYGYQGTYESDDLYLKSGLKPSTTPTPDLKWESNKQWNVGLDFSFLSRLSGTVEYYSRTSHDLLYYKELPLSAQVGAASGYNMNIGDLRNSGVEITVNANIFTSKDFRWDIDANMSTLKNEVTYLPTGAYTYAGTACTYKMEEGKSIYEFIAPQYDGVNPETGLPGWLIRDGNGGWVRTEDQAKVTTDDFVYCGSAIPKVFGSITNNFQFKGIDLSFMFYYSYGSKISDYTYKERIMNRPGVGVVQELVEDRWRQPGDAGTLIPRWSYTQYGATVKYADNFVFDNHYWRLRNLTLGYTLPKNISRKALVENLRVYVTGNNLLTFGPAKKRFTDPETGVMGNSYNGNAETDNGIQGSRRLYMVGIQITL
ncbi:MULTISPECIES: TonB-dependent receptor [Parabacteroides]|uniref:SusC/RagA family TonB-linked outer membrane protein n=1 Tax=Parabacteroides leei TaxID=2939491 RepID=UPI001E534BB2|nr:TonB-dependent receptor [Parabacteroides goldsteinii]